MTGVEGDRDIDDSAGSSQIASVRMAISGLTRNNATRVR